MIDWLADQPNLLVILMASGAALLLVMATSVFRRHASVDEPGSKAALEAYKIIVTFTAITLSFSLVQAQTALVAADAAASREAGALNQLDRVLLRYQTPGADAIRPLLRTYVAAVLTNDWPALQKGTGSAEGRTSLGALNRAVQTLDGGMAVKPQLYAEMLKQLDGINDSRQERNDLSGVSLPLVLWEAIGALVGILLLLSSQIRTEGRLIAIGGHAVAVAVLMALVFIVDRPYRGEGSVSPAPIERVLATIKARTTCSKPGSRSTR